MVTRKNKIRYLVMLSRSQGKLDPKKIRLIAQTLSRREFVLYYKLLVKAREAEKVYVTSAITVPAEFAQRIAKLFPEMDVSFVKDPKILTGLTVQMRDFIFDASLKQYLQTLKKQYEIN